MHAAEDISELDGQQMFLAASFTGKQYLFYSQLPISINEFPIYPQNYNIRIDCAIQDFQVGCEYTTARFRFDELQYLCPSSDMASKPTPEQTLFTMMPRIVKEFDVSIDGKTCEVKILTRSEGCLSERWHMDSFSEIGISFERTSDLEFLHKVYTLVYFTFVFICNRQNISSSSMKLKGDYSVKASKNGEIVYTTRECVSEMFFFNQYREEPEEKNETEKLIWLRSFLKHIDGLFRMIADDLSHGTVEGTEKAGETEDGAFISIGSIHPSIKRRKLIDLQQSLHITGEFEFYVRRYLPPMTEEKEHHAAVKEVLEAFIKTHTGKAKKLAKSLLKHVGDVSLSEKIIAAYEGYAGWDALKPCISEDWFHAKDIEKLADAANEWRNELAHEKREYKPSVDTINAIRLVEHLNYAIVLRKIGYDDREIQLLLDKALTR